MSTGKLIALVLRLIDDLREDGGKAKTRKALKDAADKLRKRTRKLRDKRDDAKDEAERLKYEERLRVTHAQREKAIQALRDLKAED
jgi:predicted ArsR family transcriptional regulator